MLTGELVRLRALEPADSEAMWRWYHDPEVGRWMDPGPPISLAQNLEKGANRPRNSWEEMLLGIETLDGVFIGYVLLNDTDFINGEATVQSIAIGDPAYWNGGYGTDALRTICRYAFEVIGLHRVMLWVVSENARAIRAYTKVGFREEGRRRQAFRAGPDRHDYVMMGMLHSELT
ncbi:MAG: GNAT family N-acetyltransferase [Kribbellaceae bacterium]|nr:GNAT family N-acetyltransferase [Kribbellaceae bacterium]